MSVKSKTMVELANVSDPALKALLQDIDIDQSGSIELKEIQTALENKRHLESEMSRLKKLLLATFLLGTAMICGLVVATVILAKETEVGSDGVLESTSGVAVKTIMFQDSCSYCVVMHMDPNDRHLIKAWAWNEPLLQDGKEMGRVERTVQISGFDVVKGLDGKNPPYFLAFTNDGRKLYIQKNGQELLNASESWSYQKIKSDNPGTAILSGPVPGYAVKRSLYHGCDFPLLEDACTPEQALRKVTIERETLGGCATCTTEIITAEKREVYEQIISTWTNKEQAAAMATALNTVENGDEWSYYKQGCDRQ